jgi:hypothetical protein
MGGAWPRLYTAAPLLDAAGTPTLAIRRARPRQGDEAHTPFVLIERFLQGQPRI